MPVWRIEGVIIAEQHLATLPNGAHSVKVLKALYREFLLTMLFFEVVKLVLLKQQVGDALLLCFVSLADLEVSLYVEFDHVFVDVLWAVVRS